MKDVGKLVVDPQVCDKRRLPHFAGTVEEVARIVERNLHLRVGNMLSLPDEQIEDGLFYMEGPNNSRKDAGKIVFLLREEAGVTYVCGLEAKSHDHRTPRKIDRCLSVRA